MSVAGDEVISQPTTELRDVWEATGFELEKLQANEESVAEEQSNLKHREAPKWHLSFTPTFTPESKLKETSKVGTVLLALDSQVIAMTWFVWQFAMIDNL